MADQRAKYPVSKMFRMTRQQGKKLETRSLKTGESQSDIIRKMIDKLR